jgi:TetR/AcrR family transcriptional repressor of mexJK operon
MTRTLPAPDSGSQGGARPRGRPPLPAADVALRRRNVVEAAARLFIAKGFDDTTLDEIGREAGVTKRTIYELVGDKNELFGLACNNRSIRSQNLDLHIMIADRPIGDILHDLAQRLIAHSFDPEMIALQRAVMIESTRCPDLVSSVIVTGRAHLIEAVAAVFDEMVAQGRIRAVDSHRTADLFFDAIVGARGFRAAISTTPETIPDDELDRRIAMFEHGYLARRPAV